jgi:hypothetical protein
VLSHRADPSPYFTASNYTDIVKVILAEAPVNADWFRLHTEAYCCGEISMFKPLLPRIQEAIQQSWTDDMAPFFADWISFIFGTSSEYFKDPIENEYLHTLIELVMNFSRQLVEQNHFEFAFILLEEVIDLNFDYWGSPENLELGHAIFRRSLECLRLFADLRSAEFCSLLVQLGATFSYQPEDSKFEVTPLIRETLNIVIDYVDNPCLFFESIESSSGPEFLDHQCQDALFEITQSIPGQSDTCPEIVRWVIESFTNGRPGICYILAYMTDKYRQKLTSIMATAFEGNVPFGALDLIATSAQYLTDYINPCLRVIQVLTTNQPRAPPAKVADALSALARVSPESLITSDLIWLSFALKEPLSPRIILTAVAIVCVLPTDDNDSISPVLQAVGEAFTRCLTPVEDPNDLKLFVEWIVPVIHAAPAQPAFVPFCEALMARVLEMIHPKLWNEAGAQFPLTELMDSAFRLNWFHNAEIVKDWLMNVILENPIAQHALVARHCVSVPIEPIWTFLHGPSDDCRVCLNGLACIVEQNKELALACNWRLIVQSMNLEPAALPEGMRILKVIVENAEEDPQEMLQSGLEVMGGQEELRDHWMGGADDGWVKETGNAVWEFCEAVAGRLKDRNVVARVLLRVVERIEVRFVDGRQFGEIGRKLCLAFVSGKKSDDYIKIFFVAIWKITPQVSGRLEEEEL